MTLTFLLHDAGAGFALFGVRLLRNRDGRGERWVERATRRINREFGPEAGGELLCQLAQDSPSSRPELRRCVGRHRAGLPTHPYPF